MPVSAIFENLEAGANIDGIMEWYEGLVSVCRDVRTGGAAHLRKNKQLGVGFCSLTLNWPLNVP